MHTCMHTYLLPYLLTYVLTLLLTYLPTYLLAYLLTYIPPRRRRQTLRPTPGGQPAEHTADSRTRIDRTKIVAPIAQSVKGRISDAGGPRFESQTGRVTGKSIPSLWTDKHHANKGLRPPEHHTGKFHPDNKKTSPSQKKTHRSH